MSLDEVPAGWRDWPVLCQSEGRRAAEGYAVDLVVLGPYRLSHEKRVIPRGQTSYHVHCLESPHCASRLCFEETLYYGLRWRHDPVTDIHVVSHSGDSEEEVLLAFRERPGWTTRPRAWSPRCVPRPPALGPPAPVKELVRAYGNHCALLEDGRMRCWGSGSSGELGYGVGVPRQDPSLAGDVQIGARVVQIALGEQFTCALDVAGRVRCWGEPWRGGIGLEMMRSYTHRQHLLPEETQPVALKAKAVRLSAGSTRACAVLTTGDVNCWEGHYGPIREENVESIPVPGKARNVMLGGREACVLLRDGKLTCWAWPGPYDDKAREAPHVVELPEPASAIVSVAGPCVWLQSGKLACRDAVGRRLRFRCSTKPGEGNDGSEEASVERWHPPSAPSPPVIRGGGLRSTTCLMQKNGDWACCGKLPEMLDPSGTEDQWEKLPGSIRYVSPGVPFCTVEGTDRVYCYDGPDDAKREVKLFR